ncbi:MAG: PEP/pyruvate-binding domain-containing protein [Dehalococcoidales bacterium]|nr:PEP/pyruvate-binding domain-containing protein [Dehalococcoidales bacterium]
MEAQSTALKKVQSGLTPLDELLQGLRLGDNVVWQVDRLEDYPYFAHAFVDKAISEGFECVYLTFAAHAAILEPRNGLTIKKIDPTPGFDYFAGEVHRIIEERGRKVCYVFDNLSDLVDEWATDELLVNFFQVTCPYLYQLDDVAYFALRRGQHAHSAIARIRDTTQILIDVYHVGGNTYVQPLKVSGRYSQQMFLPHLITLDSWEPVSRSGDAAKILATAVRKPLNISSESIAPWDSVYRKLVQNRESLDDWSPISHETKVLKEALSRMMIGNHTKLIQLSERHLSLGELLRVRDRLIGSGRIGGKAAGMILARSVLLSGNGEIDFSQVLEEHDSFYIGSDVFFTFLVNNDLFEPRLELTKTGSISRDEFAKLEQKFFEGRFPDEIMEQFRGMIDYYGQAPIIVRSSSLLEDGFTDAFAGKYRSEFCANQGSPEERLNAFLRAIKLVYASALNPDALAYRHRRGLGEGDEQMAVLVQRVSGMPYKRYFFPILAGVAFSRNLYAWTNRIDPKKGMIRLVYGLGTRAVNRVSGDYPRMIAVSHPNIRPETGMEAAKYSQRLVDIINLEENTLDTRPFSEIIKGNNYPVLSLLTSEIADGYLRDWFVTSSASSSENLVLTFNNIINRTALVKIIGEILRRLEEAWGQPVDIEFTAYVDSEENIRVNLLQCRTLRVPTLTGPGVDIPKELPKEQVLFRSSRAINAGMVDKIGYIIYIDPKKYAENVKIDTKKALGRVIGKLNNYLRKKQHKVMMMGPGRWGSNNIELGVNVGYADIDNTAVLVEVAREKAGHTPEVSYGTHFFQDLVESDILYLPVYPDEDGSDFNTSFFSHSPNVLGNLLPEFKDYEDIILVIDLPMATDGASAKVIADPKTRHAVCFLEKGQIQKTKIQKKGKK